MTATKKKSTCIKKLLSDIQKNLHAPKSQYNAFGKYKYRKAEDILEGVKPHLVEGSFLLISDEIISVGDRIYVKATATLKYGDDEISTSAFARESLTKKGMDDSQITGSTSSYARKYALNGLFLIDDNQDPDAGKAEDEPTPVKKKQPVKKAPPVKPVEFKPPPVKKLSRKVQEATHEKALTMLASADSMDRLKDVYSKIAESKVRMDADLWADIEAKKNEAKEDLNNQGRVV